MKKNSFVFLFIHGVMAPSAGLLWDVQENQKAVSADLFCSLV